jgi:hypothetical protein
MSEEVNKASTDATKESVNRTGDDKSEAKGLKEVGSIGAFVMKSIAEKRTNASSGSLNDGCDDGSIEIDFGGHVESRKSRGAKELIAQAIEPAAFRPTPVRVVEARDNQAPFDLINNRKTLTELAEKCMANSDDKKQFFKDIATFESDFVQRSHKDGPAKLREMANTYEQISRLLSAEHDVLGRYTECNQKPADTPWRVQVAQQVMHQAAEPFSISQGPQAICSVASLEVREYYREPAAVSRLVSDVVLTGKYTPTVDGKTIDMTACKHNLIPDVFSMNFNVVKNVAHEPVKILEHATYKDFRSFASQIFDNTAINIGLQPRGYRFEQPARADYVGAKKQPNGHVVDLNSHVSTPWGSGDKRQVSDVDIAHIAHRISGKEERHFVLTAAKLNETERASYEMRKAYDWTNRDIPVTSVFSKTSLAADLKKVEDSGEWPPIVRLDASLPPISSVGSSSHFVVISKMSADGKLLSVDNTWDDAADHNGQPSVPTNLIAESMFSTRINPGSDGSGYAPLMQFIKDRPNDRKIQEKSWLDMSDRLKASASPGDLSSFVKAAKDPELSAWVKAHPQDVDLSVWKERVLEWRAKYPR